VNRTAESCELSLFVQRIECPLRRRSIGYFSQRESRKSGLRWGIAGPKMGETIGRHSQCRSLPGAAGMNATNSNSTLKALISDRSTTFLRYSRSSGQMLDHHFGISRPFLRPRDHNQETMLFAVKITYFLILWNQRQHFSTSTPESPRSTPMRYSLGPRFVKFCIAPTRTATDHFRAKRRNLTRIRQQNPPYTAIIQRGVNL
jgi:hypothetical protein